MVRHNVQLNMETTFYDEQSYHNVDHRKRNMTLDLNTTARPQTKKMKLADGTPILSTPDINKLVLPTPELEKLIAQGSDPVPSGPLLYHQAPTKEQEQYARGFFDALNELHHSDSSQSGHQQQPTYTNLDLPQHYYPHDGLVVKDEPQTVPSIGSSPPMSPIDMDTQEVIKLQRKRLRNRIAASKCRRRKLERISKLEDKVKILKSENSELSGVVLKLKEHVCMLKEQVMEHVNSGCQIMANTPF